MCTKCFFQLLKQKKKKKQQVDQCHQLIDMNLPVNENDITAYIVMNNEKYC